MGIENNQEEATDSCCERPLILPSILNAKINTMNRADQMTSLVQVLETLRLQKKDNEFRWTEEGFTIGRGKFYQPEDLKIVKTFRFEGESNPDDSSVLYIIEANDGLMGYSINTYGAGSSHDDEEGYDNFLRKITVENRDEQLLFQL